MNTYERIYEAIINEGSTGIRRLARVVNAQNRKKIGPTRGNRGGRAKPIGGTDTGLDTNTDELKSGWHGKSSAVKKLTHHLSAAEKRYNAGIEGGFETRMQRKDAADRAAFSSLGSRASGMVRRGRSFKEFGKTMETAKAKATLAKEKRRAINRDIGREPTQGEGLKKSGGGKNVYFAKKRHEDAIADKDITTRAKKYRLKRLIRAAGKAQQGDQSKHQ